VPDARLSRVFAALADPTRCDIVARLAVGDQTGGHLAEPYGVSVQAISKHLKVLQDAGLVSRSHAVLAAMDEDEDTTNRRRGAAS